MMGNLIRTTRVHSTAALNGLVFTSFIEAEHSHGASGAFEKA